MYIFTASLVIISCPEAIRTRYRLFSFLCLRLLSSVLLLPLPGYIMGWLTFPCLPLR